MREKLLCIHIVALLLTLAMSGCFEDPSRTHPLDPLGENFADLGALSVRVTNFYAPRSGFSDASVQITPGNILGLTDATGTFVIPALESGAYTVHIEKEGFTSLDTLVQIEAGRSLDLDIPLAGLPLFKDVQVNSLHLGRWFPPPEDLFSLEITVEMEDPDGIADIDSLWFVLDEFGFSEYIPVQTAPGTYVHTIPEERLPVALGALPGRVMQIKAKDRLGITNYSDPTSVVRIINERPFALTPADLNTISEAQPTFIWQPILLDYPFTYRIDIVRVEQNVQSTLLTLSGIDSSLESVVSPESIPSGEYFWTVSLVDEFGNRSRSREAGFRIQ